MAYRAIVVLLLALEESLPAALEPRHVVGCLSMSGRKGNWAIGRSSAEGLYLGIYLTLGPSHCIIAQLDITISRQPDTIDTRSGLTLQVLAHAALVSLCGPQPPFPTPPIDS